MWVRRMIQPAVLLIVSLFCFSGPQSGSGTKSVFGAKCLAAHQVVKIQ